MSLAKLRMLVMLKNTIHLLTVLLGLVCCGCGSVVKSSKETALPKTTQPLTSIRYYLPRGRVQVAAAWNILIPGWEPKITTMIEADPSACYRVERKANVFFDDQVTLQVDPMTGLLQSAGATSTDQSVSALANLMSGAASAMTFGANLGAASGAGTARGLTTEEQAAEDKREQEEFTHVTNNAFSSSFSLILDYRNPKQEYFLVEPDNSLPSAGNAAGGKPGQAPKQKLYAHYIMELKRLNEETIRTGGAKDTSALDGIVVRTSIPHQVIITATFYREGRHPISQKQQSTTNIVFLPDEECDYFLPLPRIPLVTTSTKVMLVNGMVQSLEVVRPSLVNAVAAVPKNILSALLPMPFSVHQSNVQVGSHGGSTQPTKSAASQ